MNYTRAERLAADVYEACNIHHLPINCDAILEHYGLRAININQFRTQPELYRLCLNFSEDSFLFRKRKLIIYKDIDYFRTRFSLMHELGHYLLGHHLGSPGEEAEANHFAGYLLAPRPYFPYVGSINLRTISFCFDISRRAAEIARENYYSWWCTQQKPASWEECLLVRLLGEDYLTREERRTHNCDSWVRFRYRDFQKKQFLLYDSFYNMPSDTDRNE